MRGEATWTTPAAGDGRLAARASATDAPRPDRDTTGAAAPGAGSRTPEGKVVLPEGVRQAATDYVLETMRKRLER